MRPRRVSLEAIDHGGFCRTEIYPCLANLLQTNKILRDAFACFFVHITAPSELHLKGKLTYQHLVLAPGAPQGNVGVGRDSLSEIQSAEILQYLLDNCMVDHCNAIDLLALQCSYIPQRWKNTGQLWQRRIVASWSFIDWELHIVRKQ